MPRLDTQDPAAFAQRSVFHWWQMSTHGNRTRFFLSAALPAVLAEPEKSCDCLFMELEWEPRWECLLGSLSEAALLPFGLAPWKDAQ
jgi:hypothetical protein